MNGLKRIFLFVAYSFSFYVRHSRLIRHCSVGGIYGGIYGSKGDYLLVLGECLHTILDLVLVFTL